MKSSFNIFFLTIFSFFTVNAMEQDVTHMDLEEIARKTDTIDVIFQFKKSPTEEVNAQLWKTIIELIVQAVHECKDLTQQEIHKAMDIMTETLLRCKQVRNNDATIIGNIGISFSNQTSQSPVDDQSLEDLVTE